MATFARPHAFIFATTHSAAFSAVGEPVTRGV